MENSKNLKWCSKCLSMSTRPRITFDKNGVCNACLWTEEKKLIDWSEREKELLSLLRENNNESGFNCVVPVSGGKDGSYVTHQLKNKYGMNPLCVTITPHTETDLGIDNLKNFVKNDVNHISINIDYESIRILNKNGFIEVGFPYYGWLVAISTAPTVIAKNFGINLVFYGEDGEVEYGGVAKTKDQAIFDTEYQKKIYLEG